MQYLLAPDVASSAPRISPFYTLVLEHQLRRLVARCRRLTLFVCLIARFLSGVPVWFNWVFKAPVYYHFWTDQIGYLGAVISVGRMPLAYYSWR